MPLYEYTNTEGDSVLLRVPVDERDNQPGLNRVAIHAQLNTVGSRATMEGDTAKSVMKGYHSEECKGGSRFKSSFTASQIKAAWSQN